MTFKYALMLAVKICSAVLLFASHLLPARFMEISEYGLYAYVVSLVTVLSYVVIWGGDKFILKQVSLRGSKSNEVDLSNLIFGVYFVIVVNVFAVAGGLIFFLRNYFEGKYSGATEILILLTLFAVSLSIISASITKGLDKVIASEVVFNVLRPLFFIVAVLACFLLFNEISVQSMLGVLLFSYFMSLLGSSRLNLKELGVNVVFKLHTVSYFYKKSFPFFLVGVGSPLLANIDLLQLGVESSVENVAIYSIAGKVVSLILLGLVSANLLIVPKLSPLFHDNNLKKMRGIIRENNIFVALLTIPAVLIITIFSKDMLLFFGSGYLPAADVLNVLLIGQVVNVFCGPVLLTAILAGEQKKAAYIVLVLCLIEWLLCILFIPMYGVMGAAYASVIARILMNVALAIVVYRYIGVNVTMLNIFDRLRGI